MINYETFEIVGCPKQAKIRILENASFWGNCQCPVYSRPRFKQPVSEDGTIMDIVSKNTLMFMDVQTCSNMCKLSAQPFAGNYALLRNRFRHSWRQRSLCRWFWNLSCKAVPDNRVQRCCRCMPVWDGVDSDS